MNRENEISYIIIVLLLIVVCLGASQIGSGSGQSPEIMTRIDIPKGYTFIDASAYGKYSSVPTWYCEENTTRKIVDCTNGNITQEYIFPEGYIFVGASAYGEYSAVNTYYCKNITTDEIFECEPKIIKIEQ